MPNFVCVHHKGPVMPEILVAHLEHVSIAFLNKRLKIGDINGSSYIQKDLYTRVVKYPLGSAWC